MVTRQLDLYIEDFDKYSDWVQVLDCLGLTNDSTHIRIDYIKAETIQEEETDYDC